MRETSNEIYRNTFTKYNSETRKYEYYGYIEGSPKAVLIYSISVDESPEIVNMMVETDREMIRQKDRDKRHLDYDFQNSVRRYSLNGGEFSADGSSLEHPIEQIEDSKADIFSTLYPESEPMEDAISYVRDWIDKNLLPQQQELFHMVYGAKLSYEEISRRESVSTGKKVSRQAIGNRVKKIHARIQKDPVIEQFISKLFRPASEE